MIIPYGYPSNSLNAMNTLLLYINIKKQSSSACGRNLVVNAVSLLLVNTCLNKFS